MVLYYAIFLGFKRAAEINYRGISNYMGSVTFSLFLSCNAMVLAQWSLPIHYNKLGTLGSIVFIYLPLLIVNLFMFVFNNRIEASYAKRSTFLIRNNGWVCAVYVVVTVLLLVFAKGS